MIHIAPCSCELHVRLRELEAELARIKEAFRPESLLALDIVEARAEKAESLNRRDGLDAEEREEC